MSRDAAFDPPVHSRDDVLRETKMSEIRMTSRGRITLPREVRVSLNLKAGDRIRFLPQQDGTVRLQAINKDISSLVGILPRPRRARTIDEINEGIAMGAVRSGLSGLRIKRRK
jgi:AbrB family looped-hinge helix DNA binding protein